jgi:hypothetical protein
MKTLTEESTEKILRRAAIIQAHLGAPTRDATSVSAFLATGGNGEYARRFSVAADALATRGHSPDEISRRLAARIESKSKHAFRRDHRADRSDLTVDPNREVQL